MAAGSPSTWRPPWFETMTPSTPSASAFSASLGCRMPLRTSGRFQRSRKRATSYQVKAPRCSPCMKAAMAFTLASLPQ